jgi:hypothetical protein
LTIKWQRRDLNQDADDLTNGEFAKFSPALRLDPPLAELPWKVLPNLFKEAASLHGQIREHKLSRKEAGLGAPPGTAVRKKKRKNVGIKASDPW